MDCETCHLNVTIPAGEFGDDVTVCPECGRNVCPGPTLAPRRVDARPPVDRVTPLATFDREAYDELEALLRDGVVRDYDFPWGPSRKLTSEDRRGLLAQLPDLVPVRRCECGDTVCLTYDFVTYDPKTGGPVIQFEVPGVAVLELDEDDRILRFECITDTREMSTPLIW